MLRYSPVTRMTGPNVLAIHGYRYLKLALAIGGASVVAWLWERSGEGAPTVSFGGTPTGYVLGTIAAAIVVLLTWFGARKRSYASTFGTVQGWLSLHVYLGLALVVIGTLHTGLELGWNVHSVAYALMMIVIASGVVGLYLYLRLPSEISRNLADDTLDSILLEIGDFDRAAAKIALQLPDAVIRVVTRSIEKTRIGGSVVDQLRGSQPDDPTEAALTELEGLSASLTGASAATGTNLFGILARRAVLVRRARRDIQLRAQMGLWLYAHVPLTVGLLVALAAHILSVSVY